MPYTKEQVLKLLKENFEELQVSELSIYDKFEALKKDLDGHFVKIDAHLEKTLEKHQSKLKEAKILKEAHIKTKKKGIQELNNKLNEFVEDIKKEHQNKIDVLNNDIKEFVIKNEETVRKEKEINKSKVKKVEDELTLFKEKQAITSKDLELEKSEYIKLYQSKKNDLLQSHQKTLEELLERYNKNVSIINEKSDKDVESLTQKLSVLKEKHDKKLQTKTDKYNKELLKVENKIIADESEVHKRRENIVKSAEKRIQVREKHIDRAESENDKRTLKQHQKDIKKLSRDRDRDLRIIDDEIAVIEAKNKQFRTNFIEENLRDISKLKQAQQKAVMELEHEIEVVQAQLDKDLNICEKDYEKDSARKVFEYKENLYDLEVHEQQIVEEIDLKLEENNFNLLQLQAKTNYDLERLASELDDRLNELQTELDERNKIHERDVNLVNVWMQAELAKIESERQIEEERHLYDLFMEDARYQEAELDYLIAEQTSRKDNFLLFEEQFKPVVTDKAEALYEYEKLEIKSRTSLKIKFLEKEIKDLESYYDALKNKIKTVYENEVKPFNTVIELLQKPLDKTLKDLKQVYEEKVDELDTQINNATSKKERKEYELNLQEVSTIYQKNKLEAETTFNESVKMYKDYIDNALMRKLKALEEASNVYQMQLDRLADAIENTKEVEGFINKESEQRMQTLMQGVHAFNQHAEKRDVVQTDSLNQFNQDKMGYLQDKIDKRTTDLNQTIIMIEKALQSGLNNFTNEEDRLRKQCDFEVSEIERKRDVKLNHIKQIKTQKETLRKTKTDQLEKEFKQASNNIKSNVSLIIEKLSNTFNTDKEFFENSLRDLDNQKSKEEKRYEAQVETLVREKDSKVSLMERELRIELRDLIDKI